MNNEIGRKITSLTLMAIMVAGGMTLAAPGMMPAAHATGTLYVSAENATFGNTFGGGQVVEIIVMDSNLAATEEEEANPTVEVNGDNVIMAQAVDGYWYAYITDQTGINALDGGGEYDFGTNAVITNFTNASASLWDNSEGVIVGYPTLSSWSSTDHGQIDLLAVPADWPIIQAFDFTSGAVEIVLEQAGANQTVNLSYENLEDYASLELDRSSGPQSAEVHMTIYDNQLNIDPTAEDVVTFGTTAGTIQQGDRAAADDFLADNGFGDNGVLLITVNSNGTFDVTADDTAATDLFLTFTETGANTGIFVNTDDNDDAGFDVLSTANRGTTMTFNYNDSPQSYLIANSTGSLDMDVTSVGDEWNSGESMSVSLTDGDRNLNTASDETFTFSNTAIPTIVMGSPVSASTTDASRVLAATFASGSLLLSNPAVLVSDLTAITSTKDVVAVNVSDCSGATGWSVGMNGTPGKIASDTTSTSSVKAVDLTNFTSTATVQVGLTGTGVASASCNIAVDFMSFGAGVNNAVYRLLLEESGDNTGVFEGSIEYIMMNQLNSALVADIADIATNADSVTMILAADATGSSAPRMIYGDTDSDGQATGIADQADANTHNGVVSFDSTNYKVADTVTVTVTDMDLNTDSDLIDVYTVDATDDVVGNGTDIVLDFTLGGNNFIGCVVSASGSGVIETTQGLADTGFTLAESDIASGIFSGTFQIPANACTNTVSNQSSTGLDLEANYTDFLDASGNLMEVGAGATITATSGSVSLDRQVYPVPWEAGDFKDHADANIAAGSIVVTISVTDADYNTSPVGEDKIASGDVVLKAYRGSDSTVIDSTLELVETAADSGTFEVEVTIAATTTINSVKLKQGDILTAEYTDPTDASGNSYLNTDSSTLDLRTASLISDKSVYVTGSDAILSIIDDDLNLDSGTVESYTLNLVNWDSDAGDVNLGAETEFDPEPSKFRETGSDTGVFQVVIEIPDKLNDVALDSGESIALEYVDHGTAGEDNYSTTSTENIGLTIYSSNFGATIELDKKVYTWTDRVFVNITAPDHNTDTGLVEEIGGDSTLTAQTRSDKLTNYKLVETGPDTGIFWGEITLNGFAHDADGDATTGNAGGVTGNEGPVATQVDTATGPTNGLLNATDSDGITVSFTFSEDQTVISSSLVRWNIAETAFDESAYLANSSAIVNVSDIDMNLNNDTVENFTVELWSDSDSGGIDLTVTETSEASGEFEGVVFFTTTDASSGHTLRVSEGDTITASYEDNTLPEPYSNTDSLSVTSTAVIGTIIPPLERAPAANLRTVDAFGADLSVVSVDQQVQLQADIANGSDGEQAFAYLVQVQNDSGVTVPLAWITGTLSSGQSMSPALSWIPTESGSYTATAFVWESVSNPTALSASISTTITVE